MEKTERITRLTANLFARPPEIESARAVILTESYRKTEHLPLVKRRAQAFYDLLSQIPIVIRDDELIVGSATLAPRGCQTFPEFSYEWLENELDTVADRAADPFFISEQTKQDLRGVHPYWKGKTVSDLARSYMANAAWHSMYHNVFTVGNYFYNGVGHTSVKYGRALRYGFQVILGHADTEWEEFGMGACDYAQAASFLEAVTICCEAVQIYANRYSRLAKEMAQSCRDQKRKAELLLISENCANVPFRGVSSFYQACQSFWFVQLLIQLESSGHSISPGRFDQYMYPYYETDIKSGELTPAFAQELLDCLWVKFNDLNKCRDAASAEGFSGYSLFQNLIVGGQNKQGTDATNDLSYMCLEASRHVFLPQPSLSIRVWNGTPHNLLTKAAELTRTGLGLPAFFNDEIIIPSMMNSGISLEEARNYSIVGCVEPHVSGKTNGWHDAAFFNMCKPLELVFSNGYDKGAFIGKSTGELDELDSYEAFLDAYLKQMRRQTSLLLNAINAVDVAHRERCPLPFLASLVDDCFTKYKTVEEGGAKYNFSGPQGFGVANMADSLFAVKKLVYDEKKYSLTQFHDAIRFNFGHPLDAESISDLVMEETARRRANDMAVTESDLAAIITNILQEHANPDTQAWMKRLRQDIAALPKYGNDVDEVDEIAREAAHFYTQSINKSRNPRGGFFQAGLYPVSANVPLGAQTGATPDGRLAHTPLADGVSPSAGKDTHGPTAAVNSVAKLDHLAAANGTLLNMKFHPSAMRTEKDLNNFISLIRSYFDQKGMHIQFNVIDRETLRAAQQRPDDYKHLVVRVAGYSALFTTLSKALQDDIINRTEQGV